MREADAGGVDAAVSAVWKALRATPDSVVLHLRLARLLIAEAPADAEALLRRAHRLDPADRAAALQTSRFLNARGQGEQAEGVLVEYLQHAPGDLDVRQELALLRLRRGDYAGAIAELDRVLAATPGEGRAAALMRTACGRRALTLEQDDPAASETLLLKAVLCGAPDRAAVLSYSRFLRRRRRDREAAEVLERYAAAAPQDKDVLHAIGAIRFALRDYAAALSSFTAVAAIDPAYPRIRGMIARSQYHMGDRASASAFFAAASSSAPATFQEGLLALEAQLEVPPDPARRSGVGWFSARDGWTEAQRYRWGRGVDHLSRVLVYRSEAAIGDILQYVDGRDAGRALDRPHGKQGALVFLLHVGIANIPIIETVASGRPYKLVANSVLHGLRWGDHIIDPLSGGAGTLLAVMRAALIGGSDVLVAIDGPFGPRLCEFEHGGVGYSVAAGPVFLAHHLRARAVIYVSHYAGDRIVSELIEGPTDHGLPLPVWNARWQELIGRHMRRIADLGPENLYRHPSCAYPKTLMSFDPIG